MKEFFGKDEQEALAKAAAELGIAPQNISYRLVPDIVVNSKQRAKVAIIVRVEETSAGKISGDLQDEEKEAQKRGGQDWVVAWCKGLLRRMGFEPSIDVLHLEEDDVLRVEFTNGMPEMNRGALRGMRGAIQHLVGRLTSQMGIARHFIIDLCGTFSERKGKMAYLASQLKNKLGENGWIGIHLMESQDRSLLHLAIKTEGLESESRGEGNFRVLGVRKQAPR